MLLSFVNFNLLDYEGSLKALCDDLQVNQQELEEKLSAIDYHYNQEKNQFV